MLCRTAWRIIVHEKAKFSGAVAGVSIAVFLMILQWGFYLGFDRDITIVLDSIDADIWIVPKSQPLFDGWATFDDLPFGKVRQHPAVTAASRVVWGWGACRVAGSGGLDSVEVLGIDLDAGTRLRFDLPRGDVAALVRPDGHILLGQGDRDKFGVDRTGIHGLEINACRATPVGFVPGVRLFTTAGFVFTSIDNARRFLRVPPSHVTYLVCQCRAGADVNRVVADLQRAMPEHDVFTAQKFHDKASHYWHKRTSIGPLILISTGLAVSVGFLIVMLVFYVSTIEKIPIFACMKALGASNAEVAGILVFQSAIVFVLGCVCAAVALYAAVIVLSHTTISVVITRHVIATGLLATAAVSGASSLLSVRRVLAADPGEAFRT